MTQKERILDYIKTFGGITALEAMRDLGIMRLASRVTDLGKDGITIERDWVNDKNRYGEPVRYLRYYLPKEQTNG